jgi:hypothetical protein
MRRMTAEPEPQTDPSVRLAADICAQLLHTMRATLPAASDSPDDLARRDRAAIALLACLAPGNADEADIAAQYACRRA